MAVRTCGAFGILERAGSLLLVANWRNLDGERTLCWDLPGGGVEAGESLEAACVREMKEETGYDVVVEDLAFMIERFGFRGRPQDESSAFHFFHVQAKGEPAPRTDPKIVDLGFKALDEFRALCTQTYHRELHEWIDGGRRQRYFLTHPD